MEPHPLGILITGAGSGVGRGLAQLLASKGRHLFLADLQLAAVEETVRLIEGRPSGASAHAFDVTSSKQVRSFLQSTGPARIDVLINNAGLQFVAGIDEFPEEKWDQLIDVMLKGPFLLTQAVLPGMRQRGFGRIINIGSIHALVASPFKSAYVAAKHGLEGLSKVIALEGAAHGVTSNCINPGYVRTPLVERQIADQAKIHGIPEDEVITRVMLAESAIKRLLEPAEVADLALWLAGPSASMATGSSFVLDGGWTAR